MLSLLSCPKKFEGENGRIQRNSIENWRQIGVSPHLAGPKEDVESIPEDLDVAKTVVDGREGGTSLPDFCDLLQVLVNDNAILHGYSNADIIFPEVFDAFCCREGRIYYKEQILPERFLIIGSRWDLSQNSDYTGNDLDSSVEGVAREIVRMLDSGTVDLNRPDAMDYFIFSPGLFTELKPLIVGRGGYDNALIAYCLRRQIPVIDASCEWPVLHQFHDYAHKQGGKQEVYLGSEAMLNRTVHDIVHSPPNSLDSDYVLENERLKKAVWRCGILRRFELIFRFRFNCKLVSYLFRGLQRFSGEKNLVEMKEMSRTRKCLVNLANR